VTDRVPEIGFSLIRNQPKNGYTRQVEQGFSSFLIAIFDDFSKFDNAFGALHFEKKSNIQKLVHTSTTMLFGTWVYGKILTPLNLT